MTADGELDPAALESKAKRQHKKGREERSAEADGIRDGEALKAGEIPTEVESGVSALQRAAESTAPELTREIRNAEASPLSATADAKPRGTLRGVGGIALGVVLLVSVIGYRRELGHIVMSFGSSIAGDEQSHSGAANPPVGVDSEGAKPEAEPAASQTPATSDEDLTKETSAESVTASPNSTEGGSAGVVRRGLQSGSAPQSSQQNAGEDVPALWSSVENGDTRAEVTLANRYIHGEGVPQSCAQARVLLEAAAKRGSTDAKEKLEGLPQVGCP